MYDSRLTGAWKSDARKTAREIAARHNISGRKKAKLQNIFGKLELRYTRTRCHTLFEGHATTKRYVVVATDPWSVAIVSLDPVVGDQIWHIHFEGDHYWVSLGGRMREYFKRIDRE